MRLSANSRSRFHSGTILLLAALLLAVMFDVTNARHSALTNRNMRVIVGYESDEELPLLVSAVKSRGGVVHSVVEQLHSIIVTGLGGGDVVSAALRGVAKLGYVEDDKTATASFTPNDPYYMVRQWAPQHINASRAWDVTRGSKAIVVAVIDTGVDYNHQDISANIWNDSHGNHGYDFVNLDEDPMDDQSQLPSQVTGDCVQSNTYHGTHVAGIVGGVINNWLGIAGLAQVRIMAVKVLDQCGRGQIGDIALGIMYAVNNGARIITLSLGGDTLEILKNAVTYAWRKGAVIVAASGNDGGGVSYPAAYESVVATGSVNRYDIRSPFSNYGQEMELVAPGEEIYSAMRVPPYYQDLTGTSQAAPQVAGVAALVLSRNPSLTNAQVREILNTTTTDLGQPGWDEEYGWGLVDAYRSVLAALPIGKNASLIDVPPVRSVAGSLVDLNATLKGTDGVGIPGRSLDFYVDLLHVGSVTTNALGFADLQYTIPEIWGTHKLEVRFTGDLQYAASTGSSEIYVESANGGSISGMVLAYGTYERLGFASVSMPAANTEVYADSNGVFNVDGVPNGTWMIVATSPGYEEKYVNVTVRPRETTVVPVVLRLQGTTATPAPETSLLVFAVAVIIVVIVIVMFLAAYSSGTRRMRAIGGQPPPEEVPPHVAAWLAQVHGLDASRFVPIEVMVVADGRQLTLMEKETGMILVVRIDKYGQPTYLFPGLDYLLGER